MNIDFLDTLPAATTLALLVGKDGLAAATAGQAQRDGLVAAASLARFEGEAGSIAELAYSEAGQPRRILLAGVGSGSGDDLEKAGAALSARLLTSGETDLTVDVRGVATEPALRLATAIMLRGWRYDLYRTKLPAKQRPTLATVHLVGDKGALAAAWPEAHAIIEGVSFTRELITEPGNIIYPESFVERCQRLADLGIEIEVLDEDAIRAAGMGALYAVGMGSERPSRLLVMRWDGSNGAKSPPLALIGKGVTFDTGGISLKPGAGMEDMKWDMGGAGTVAGTMLALATRKSRAHVVAVCALAENMPDGKAQRPGDVVTTMSGQTVEVINTDAEGRLVLCDAMTWVQRRYSPKTMVDLATLTGAMIVSLGHEQGGLFSNDDSLAQQLTAAGAVTGDKLWRMPLGDSYNKLIDSQIADMKNVGPREAGSITAAQFLQRFVDDGVKWAHLDIAGMVWSSKPGAVWDKGATGYGVRLLDRFVRDNWEG